MVTVFNDHCRSGVYGPSASESLPVKVEDVMEPHVNGGSSDAVNDCRKLAVYIIAQHVLVFDRFTGRNRLMTLPAVGGIFGCTKAVARNRLLSCCKLLERPVFARVYSDTIDAVSAAGHELWNTPSRKVCE